MMAQKTVRIQKGSYWIEQSIPEPVPPEVHPSLFKFSNIVAWSLWIVYSFSQFLVVCRLQIQSGRLLWEVWIMLMAEAALSFQQAVISIHILLGLFVKRVTTRPSYWLMGRSAPTIDVFITCCGEKPSIIRDTIAATIALDYPPERFRVLVLDDGRDHLLREIVESLSKTSPSESPQVKYLSRSLKAGAKSYYKAGNLQYGIEETERLGGSDFIASLDADMIPEPTWLRMMVPHFIMDDRLAVACPTQVFWGNALCNFLLI